MEKEIKMELQPNEGQKEAIDLIYGSNNRVLLTGAPGTGKSFTIAQSILRMRGQKVVIACPSHKAKHVVSNMLDEAGIYHEMDDDNDGKAMVSVMTIHRYLGYALKDGTIPTEKDGSLYRVTDPKSADVLFLEEYSMLNKQFQKEAEETAHKVVLVGDIDQLPPILKKGESPADISYYAMVELTEQMRQNVLDSSLYKTIAAYRTEIRTGKPFKRFPDDDSLIHSTDLIKDYVNGKIDIIIAYKNATVDHANDLIQTEFVGDKYPKKDDTLILQAPLKEFQSFGSPVIVANNGDAIYVLSDAEPSPQHEDVYSVETTFGPRIVFPNHVNPFEFSKRYNIPWREMKQYAIKAKLPYATTSHKAQGSSYDNVGIALGDLIHPPMDIRSKLLYVAFSRAKHKAYYTI